MNSHDILLCNPVRTAIGAYNGALKGVPATELGATVVRETVSRAGLAPETIGCVKRPRGHRRAAHLFVDPRQPRARLDF